MAKYSNTKAKINEKIATNGRQAVTGAILNDVLQTMVDSLGADYQFGGLVQPGSSFTAGEQPVVFLATTPGTYTNFGGLVVADGEVALLVWSGTAWNKQTPDIATRTEVSQLGQKVTYLEQGVLGKYSLSFKYGGLLTVNGQEYSTTTRVVSQFLSAFNGVQITAAHNLFNVLKYDANFVYLGADNAITWNDNTSDTLSFKFNGYIRIVMRKDTSDSNISPSEIDDFLGMISLVSLSTMNERIDAIEKVGQDIQIQIGGFDDYVLPGYYYNTSGERASGENYSCLKYLIPVGSDIYYSFSGGINLSVRCFDESMQYLGDAVSISGGKIVLQSGTKTVGIYWTNGGSTPGDYSNDYFIYDETFIKIIELQNDITTLRGEKIDKYSLNRFNPNDPGNSTGYLNSSGEIVYYANYVTTALLPVNEGETYYKAKDDTSYDFARVALYNSQKQFIPGTYQEDKSSFTIPSGASYMRVTLYASSTKKQVAPADVNYLPYNPISQWLFDLIGDFTDKSKDVVIDRAKTYLTEFFNIRENFIDNSYINPYSGEPASADTYARTSMFPVLKGQYRYNGFFNNGFFCYNSSKTYLGEAEIEQESQYSGVVTLLENTAYVCINFQKSSQPSGYKDNGVFYNLEPYVEMFPPKNEANILYGKKWVVVGDSFSAWSPEQFASGKYSGRYKTYKYFIALRNNMVIGDMTQSGRTMAYPSDHTFDNAFAKESIYQSIPADADYITIMLGINDASHLAGYSPDGESTQGAISLGTIDSTDTGTFYGAWNVVMQWIFENRPLAHIGIIITNGLGSQGPSGQYSQYDLQIYNALKDIVKRWNVPYIDLNGGDGKTPMMQRGIYPEGTPSALIAAKWNAFATTPTGDMNGHTNVNGHLYESTFIENFLRSL